MAIKVISGKPGSGKSYYALYKLIVENYEFDKKFFEWKVKTPINIFTNIDGLKLPHESLDDHIKQAGGLSKFFTVDYQKKLMETYPNIRYIIDESQKFFPKRMSDTEILFFFQYHRHLGIDIYLITPNWLSLSAEITGLCEYEIRAKEDTLTLFKELKYGFYAGFDRVGSTSLPADRRVFALYKSFDAPDKGKKIKPLQKYAFQFAALALVVVISGGIFFKKGFASNKEIGADQLNKTYSTEEPKFKSRPAAPQPVAASPGRATSSPPPQASMPPIPQKKLIVVELGGLWVGDQLTHVLYNGDLFPILSFPYTIISSVKGDRVRVLIPSDDLIAKID